MNEVYDIETFITGVTTQLQKQSREVNEDIMKRAHSMNEATLRNKIGLYQGYENSIYIIGQYYKQFIQDDENEV